MGKPKRSASEISGEPGAEDGLGNQAILSKIDQLRELNVGSIIPLPQLIVVGDQSSGKSSVLEGLTGFSFPRAAGLCTRYATQITCRREEVESVYVTIIPRPNANAAQLQKLRAFQRSATRLNNDELSKIFLEANIAMGIRMGDTDEKPTGGAFSEDILKIEICGPNQSHLTVIDVPGIFRNATPGLTTDADVQLVRNMVTSYMNNSRTVILAVMPCNVDIATQEIIKLAGAADPDGSRTMGVLTKPDLATERATQSAVLDLLLGKRSNLSLGYCVVKNRSADDNDSTVAERRMSEKAFFAAPAWASVADRCGVPSLQKRLRDLLMQISKREFPHVKLEIDRGLKRCEEELAVLGQARGDEASQRAFLCKIGSRFQMVAQSAVNGHYIEDNLFRTTRALKLATSIMELNEIFANNFWRNGHTFQLAEDPSENAETPYVFNGDESLCNSIDLAAHPDIEDTILTEECPVVPPSTTPIQQYVQHLYATNRGPEIGTFNGTILAMVFEEQSTKWDDLVLSHTSKAIVLVHDFIAQLLEKLCPDTQIREDIWEVLLIDRLRDAYKRAMDHTRFLLKVERGGRPTTFNHYFNSVLQKKRTGRITKDLDKLENKHSPHSNEKLISLTSVKQQVTNKSNTDQVCEDIVDTLASYYKVARKRFVDTICQQAINYFLLDGEGSPLKILNPELIMDLDARQLDRIAGEDATTRERRETLLREQLNLGKARKILRA